MNAHQSHQTSLKHVDWRRLARHLAFWLLAGLALYFLIKSDQGSWSFSLVFTLLILPIVIATSYGFIYWLFPRFLFQGRFLPFAIYGLFLFVASIYFETMVILWSLVFLGDYQFANMTPISMNIAQLGVSLYFIVFFLLLAHLLRHRVLKKETGDTPFLVVRADRQNRQVPMEDILYIESLDDYVTIHLAAEDITTRLAISKLAASLPNDFVRVHRSFLVNRKYVKSFTKEKIAIGETEVPISRTYKESALDQLAPS